VSARQLIDRGREHIAAGRGTDALDCFALAAEDPVHGPEALSLLAAAYLLPGVGRPALALTSVRRVATTPCVGMEHLTRCAAVALTAGDPGLAEELASRAARSRHADALPILATAKVRRGDRAGLRQVLRDTGEVREPAAFWRRLMIETVRRGWLPEALAVRRKLRQAALPAPGPMELLVHVLPTPILALVLLAGPAAALVVSHAAIGVPLLLASTAVAVVTVKLDWVEARVSAALCGAAWLVTSITAPVLAWLL
jgi:hypothetical protein